ncbi:MAG: hypothetical protein ABFD91_17490 [Anaerohalosphaeraceae bacterium]
MKNAAYMLLILCLLGSQGCVPDSEEASPKEPQTVSMNNADDSIPAQHIRSKIHYIVIWQAGDKIYKILAPQEMDRVFKIMDSLKEISPNELGAVIPSMVVNVSVSDGSVDHRYELYETADGTEGDKEEVSSIMGQFNAVLKNTRSEDSSEDIFNLKPHKLSYLLLKTN